MDDTLVETATRLHEQWRVARLRPDGSSAPCWKDDRAVDIANTDFTNLPHPWQAENLASARAALEAVTSSSTLEEAAEQVHQDWLVRNSHHAPAAQNVPYSQLSTAEQDKDRLVAQIAATVAGVSLD